MTETPTTKPRFKLSQDWQATIAGLFLVAIIGSGLIGPGPHRVTLTAAPGETISASAKTVDGWRVMATLGEGDEASTILDASDVALDDTTDWTYVCESVSDGLQFSMQDAEIMGDGQSVITLANGCDEPITMRLTIDAFIIWPLFGLFD